jgi:hypothetical protein
VVEFVAIDTFPVDGFLDAHNWELEVLFGNIGCCPSEMLEEILVI